MQYALNVAPDGRVLSATFAQYAPADAVQTDALPVGDIGDYRMVNGAFVLDPLPKPAQPNTPTLEQRTAAMEDAVAELILGGGNYV